MNLLISNPLTATLSMALVRVTLLLSLAWLCHFLLRNRNPRWQITVWRGTTLGIPLIMGFSFFLPGWGPRFSDFERNLGRHWPDAISLPSGNNKSLISRTEVSAAEASTSAVGKPAAAVLSAEVARPGTQSPRFRVSIGEIILWFYSVVAMLLIVRLVLQGIGLSRMVQHCSAPGERLSRIKHQVCQRLKMPWEPEILVSESVSVPLATFIPRSVIVIPRNIADSSSISELEHLIAHECCHFSGQDFVWSTGITILRIFLWFHPLSWGLPAAHRVLCDVRCDSIACGEDRFGYAAMLARFAMKLQKDDAPALSLAFVRGSETLQRVLRVQAEREAGFVSRTGQIGNMLAILIVIGVIGSFGVHSLVNQPFLEVNKDELRRVSMTIHGPDGKPVAGAEISVHGLRTVKEPASGHGNRMQNKATTNDKGEATVEYPRFVYEEMETGQLIFTVSHPDFVPFSSQGESVDNLIKVTMDAGRRVRITAKDSATGTRLSEPLFVIQPGDSNSIPWKTQEDGSLLSNALDNSLSLLLVVCLREGQPALFSDLIHLETFPEGDCRIDDVPMSPGRVLRGQLSENVPRPVINGHIGLTAASSINERPGYDNSIFWQDSAVIGEDGTFEFASVPRDIDIQLIANCDGWVSQSAPAEEILQRFPYVTTDDHARMMRDSMTIAQLFSVEPTAPVVLQMESTTTCEFTVLDQSGAPVPDATIYLSPNAVWSPGPGGIVGHYYKTSAWLGLTSEQTQAQLRAMRTSRNNSFRATTNAEGIAVMKDVPGKKSLSASIEHKEMDLAPNDSGNPYFRHYQFSTAPGETVQLSLTVQPKDAVVIGR